MRYECHVTTEYVNPDDFRFKELTVLAPIYGFRVAKLFMQKGTPSNIDTFMTAHSDSFHRLRRDMGEMVESLRRHDFQVRRFKIEEILLDSRNGDEL